MSAFGIERPVGLFGLVRNSNRVSRSDRREYPVSRKREIRTERHFDHARAGRRRSRRIHVEGRNHDDGVRNDRAADSAAPRP